MGLCFLQAESAGLSSTAVLPPRGRPQEEEEAEDSEAEGSEVSYGSDQPPGQSDADSDAGELLSSACTEWQVPSDQVSSCDCNLASDEAHIWVVLHFEASNMSPCNHCDMP